MRFNFRLLLQSKKNRIISLIIIIFFVLEYLVAEDVKKKNPTIKGVKFLKNQIDSHGNNSFVYYYYDGVDYPIINNSYFNIKVAGSVLSPHFKTCVNNQYFDDITFTTFNNEPLRSWSYDRKKTVANTKFMGAKAGDLYLSKDLFRMQGSDRDYIPTKSNIRNFQKSRAYSDGFKYIGDGWFYLPNGYDVEKAFKLLSRQQKTYQSSSSSFVYFGNPMITIVYQIIAFIIKNYKNKQARATDATYNLLFENCKEGDVRVRFRVFDSNDVSMIAYRTNNVIKPGYYDKKRYGRIVSGYKTMSQVMRPFNVIDDKLFLLKVTLIIGCCILVRNISETPKEFNANILLLSIIVYTVRSFIWDFGILKPAIAISLLIVFLIAYAQA